MKQSLINNKTTALFFSLIIGLLLVGSSFGTMALAGEDQYGAENVNAEQTYTIEEMLNYAIEDEYKARAEYELIIEEMDRGRPFTNIVKAEETHIAMLTSLFAKYGVELPADNAFEHTVLPNSIDSALETGVKAEIDNIAMYEQFLSQDLPEDIEDTCIRLKNGSQNHLEAFQRVLSGGNQNVGRGEKSGENRGPMKDRNKGTMNDENRNGKGPHGQLNRENNRKDGRN
ncbi:DUF2202 domain-containing protein [Candidatus Bipolaricaulota bacterium]|nr:DUF2202 domain-containing protein [Candidatus Bipolaricaulota bacterium]